MSKEEEALKEFQNWQAIDELLYMASEENPDLVVNYPVKEFRHPMESVPQPVKYYRRCDNCDGNGCVVCEDVGYILIEERPMNEKELRLLNDLKE